MDMEKEPLSLEPEEQEPYEPPLVVEAGRIEAKLFSDEPDPWGP